MKANNDDLLLRRALRANAAFSTMSGLTLVVGSYLIGPWIGVEPSWIVLLVGLGLLPFAYSLFANAKREVVNLGEVKSAIAGDIAWVIGSITVVVVDPTGLTTAGIVTILLIAAVVADFALLQWMGLRRVSASRASQQEGHQAGQRL